MCVTDFRVPWGTNGIFLNFYLYLCRKLLEMNRTEILKAVGNELVKAITEEENEHLTRLEHRRITPESIIPHRRFLFRLFGKPCFPRGELVAVTGRAKSGKTFVTSILMTLAVCREVLGMRREEEQRLRVLWMDTEQSEESTQEILCDRIMKLWQRSGGQDEIYNDFPLDMFDIFNVRADFWQDRLPMLEAAIEHYRPDLVIIDGIRDLVNDINDGVLSQEIIERLMHLASDGECCIVNILHQNKASEDKNLRGWIGTELTYKSFEVYECTKDADRIFSLKQTMTRKYDIIDNLQFIVNDDGLPEVVSYMPMTPKGEKYPANPTVTAFCDVDSLDFEKLFEKVLAEGEELRAYELKNRFLKTYNAITMIDYFKILEKAVLQNVVQKTVVNSKCVYYSRGTKLRNNFGGDLSAPPSATT